MTKDINIVSEAAEGILARMNLVEEETVTTYEMGEILAGSRDRSNPAVCLAIRRARHGLKKLADLGLVNKTKVGRVWFFSLAA